MTSDEDAYNMLAHDPLLVSVLEDLSSSDIKVEGELLPELLGEALDKALPRGSKQLLRTLKKGLPGLIVRRTKDRLGFEKRLQRLWGTALNKLEMLIVCSLEAGQDYTQTFYSAAARESDFCFFVLMRLHARGVLIAQEVLTLLRSGFPDGAHARWRTLHEVAVVSLFVSKHGKDTAERYLLHEAIESHKALQQYQEHCARLSYTPFTDEEVRAFEKNKDSLLQRFGKDFNSDYGWASAALGKARPNFSDLEADVDLEHYRPLYRMSGHSVHAGPKGIAFNLGGTGSKDILLAGPSNGGLADPGHATAISVLQLTLSLIEYEPRLQDLITGQMMMLLTDEIGEAFMRAHERWKKRANAQEDI